MILWAPEEASGVWVEQVSAPSGDDERQQTHACAYTSKAGERSVISHWLAAHLLRTYDIELNGQVGIQPGGTCGEWPRVVWRNSLRLNLK